MKTIINISILFLALQFNLSAQVNRYQLDDFQTEHSITKSGGDKLKPVFYNFSKRRLYTSNQMPLNAQRFLFNCRQINDNKVQFHIQRYDQLTRNKKKLVAATIICGVGGYVGMIVSSGHRCS